MQWLLRIWDSAWRTWDAFRVASWLLGFAGGAGIVTAGLSVLAEVPWHLVVLYGLQAAASATVLFVGGFFFMTVRDVRGRLRIGELVAKRWLHNDDGSEYSVYLEAVLYNASPVSGLWYTLDDASLSIEDRTSQESEILTEEPIYIPPGQRGGIAMATISGLPKADTYKGRVRLKLSYGRSSTKLPYKINHDTLFTIDVNWLPDGQVQSRILPLMV